VGRWIGKAQRAFGSMKNAAGRNCTDSDSFREPSPYDGHPFHIRRVAIGARLPGHVAVHAAAALLCLAAQSCKPPKGNISKIAGFSPARGTCRLSDCSDPAICRHHASLGLIAHHRNYLWERQTIALFAFRGELPSYSTAARLDNGMPSVPVPDVPGLEGAHKVGPHALAQRTQRPEVLNRTGLEQPPLRIWYRQNRPG